MSQDTEMADVEGDKEDRISDLPRNIIDGILELLPAQDAARTSILSKKWRNVWSMLPYVVLDHHFHDELTETSYSFFVETVYAILLLHRGVIIKFVLDVPAEPLSSYTDVDRWIRYVTGNGVKEFSLSMSDIGDRSRIYELPSCVFSCTNLTRLNLHNCVVKPGNSYLAFPKLETLHLHEITVSLTAECVLNVPRLITLHLVHCDGTEYLNIVSPLLEFLEVHHNHYLVLNSFLNCKKLRELYLRHMKMVDDLKHDERSTLKKLMFSLAPTLEKLCLDTFFLELLIAERIPEGPLSMFKRLWYLSLLIDFKELSSISGALQLIRSVPNLCELEIYVDSANEEEAEVVVNYLNTPTFLDQPLNKLKHVVVRWFWGSKAELLFIKLLLARTPSLVSMAIELVRPGSREELIFMTDLTRLNSRVERIIVSQLISLPKASPRAGLFIYHASLT